MKDRKNALLDLMGRPKPKSPLAEQIYLAIRKVQQKEDFNGKGEIIDWLEAINILIPERSALLDGTPLTFFATQAEEGGKGLWREILLLENIATDHMKMLRFGTGHSISLKI